MSLATRSSSLDKLLTIQFDREEDGRWIAEIPEMSGVMVYGNTKQEAESRVQALALRVLADQIEQDQSVKVSVRFAVA